jgi:hypothetical protein
MGRYIDMWDIEKLIDKIADRVGRKINEYIFERIADENRKER